MQGNYISVISLGFQECVVKYDSFQPLPKKIKICPGNTFTPDIKVQVFFQQRRRSLTCQVIWPQLFGGKIALSTG